MERKQLSSILGLVTAGALIWGGHEYRQVQAKTTEISQVKRQKAALLKKQAHLKAPSWRPAKPNRRRLRPKSALKTIARIVRRLKLVTRLWSQILRQCSMVCIIIIKTLTTRQAKVKHLLSPKLNQQYFGGKSQLYGDGSQVTSKLTQLRVYRQALVAPS
ncbi:hypothetical protein EQH94_16845 (plasmid) [Lactiplantibacillus plantarum]|uniref:hypothetical protein n=1 Tax=Lactiplantibacillus plantarum TaxID=1590 RepID=UPI000FF8FAC2|nr:hypothetical protein [Lactiplantibacillus plantarum]QAR77675.1 hypothetical protein EQH94_16845 [Lactiplantibacillus plantarum]